MSEALIIRDDTNRAVTFLPQAHALKTAALEQAALIGKVETPADNQTAFEAQSTLANLRKLVEKARVAAKEPVLEFGRQIDASAKSFIADIANEEMRIATLIGDFQQLERAKQLSAEKAKRLEEERIERDRQSELRRIAEEQAAAERKRQTESKRIADEAAAVQRRQDAEQAEIARKAREATNAKERAAAEQQRKELEARQTREREESERQRIELERAQALAAATSHEAFDKANEKFNNLQADVQAAPSVAPVRAAGQKVVTETRITVTDIHKLYKFHANCVKLEPILSEIKSLVAAGVKVQGIITEEIIKSQSVRAGERPAIEV